MALNQLSVFVDNTPGALSDIAEVLANAGINLRALSIADTAEFGILRIIVDKPEETLALLKQAQFTCTITDMLAIQMDDRPGSMAKVIRLLADADISIEYAYAFTTARAGTAITIVRVENNAAAEFVLKDTPFKSVGPEILDT